MCGIVGYAGSSNGLDSVIEGLSRLEYRGYDSSGIGIQVDSKLNVFKTKGKLQNLKNLLKEEKNIYSNLVIGHTRWATHGGVTEANAHPHKNDDFCIVHNGIIENATAIRNEMKDKGYDFLSQTDSETFLAKLTDTYKKTQDVKRSIIDTFKVMEGNSAFVIIHREDHKIYSIKKSAPLVCGLNEKTSEVFVSSDPYALIGFATKIYFPDDNILCVGDIRKNTGLIEFFDLDGNASQSYKIQEKQMSLDVASKGGYDHFMLKEIFEQPELINKLISIYTTDENSYDQLKEIAKTKPAFFHIIACGTALHAGLLIKTFLENHAGIRTQYDYASEFRYRNPKLQSDEIGLFISQSGETADTLACQELCHENGLKTFSIVNVDGSTLFRNCDQNLLLHAGKEIGVASTKAFTQMVLVGYLLSKAYQDEFGTNEIKDEFKNAANAISKVLERESEIQAIAKEIYNYKGYIFTGRGQQFPVALEGALKLKEIAYVHAEGYAAGELKHGPIALFDEEMINIAIVTKELFEKTLSNAQEVKARNGVMVVLGEDKNEELEDISDYYFGIDYFGVKELKPIISNVVLQLLSYHIAKLKGTDIDKPRNLAKSVTVE